MGILGAIPVAVLTSEWVGTGYLFSIERAWHKGQLGGGPHCAALPLSSPLGGDAHSVIRHRLYCLSLSSITQTLT